MKHPMSPSIFRHYAVLSRFVLAAVVICADAYADIYRVIGKGNTIAPLRSSEIAMDAEQVVVFPESDFGGFRVRATFTMRNTADQVVQCDVAFPFDSKSSASIARPSFKVSLGPSTGAMPDGTIELKVRDESVKTPRSPYDFPAALVWPVTWRPRETLIIHIQYDMGEPEQYYGLVEGWRLRYIVRTGALWHGPIGEADITFRLNGNSILSDDFAGVDRVASVLKPPFSYPANATRGRDREVTWHFKNWTPEEDIWLGVIRWNGCGPGRQDRVFIRLPKPYAGAESAYADALLESITAAELAPWRDMFPEETKSEHAALKAYVAVWLYHEILARHGDPFFLGKRVPGEPAPPDARGTDRNDNYLSVWSERFPNARSIRNPGWYKPGTGRGPNGSVRLTDLSAQERRNLEFLAGYFRR
jgi:hypothetical protein